MKQDENGEICRYKARLVAQGFSQKYGVVYSEVYAPVANTTTVRVLLSFAGKRGFSVKQYDIKTAFLNGDLSEEIYLRQPQGFKEGEKVYKLHKSLYGLKQAARVWNETLHKQLLWIGFAQSDIDKCLYVLREHNNVCYFLVHVDDMLLASDSDKLITSVASRLSKKFEITSLGSIKYYLNVDIMRDERGNLMMSQASYIAKIIEAAGLCDAKPSKYPLDPGYYKIEDDKLLPDNNEYRKLIGLIIRNNTLATGYFCKCSNIGPENINTYKNGFK